MRPETKRSSSARTRIILITFCVAAIYLLCIILRLTLYMSEYYRSKAYEQITTSTVLKAERGLIYDINMNVLAQSGNVWRIFVSPREIHNAEAEDGGEYGRLIANGLGNILNLDKDKIYEKLSNNALLDVTIKKAANKSEYDQVIEFINQNSLQGLIFTELETSRNYPEGTLAAHVLGFTGSDNQGLYGLEYQYNNILSGKDGYYVYAKDANGMTLDTEYSSYQPAIDGQSIVTTLDSYIQSELETVIENARINHDAENRVCGIVMDTTTGAILAMATTGAFNPNSPFELDSVSIEKLEKSGLDPSCEEYKKYKTELMQIMWSNKAISEIYEPGSTFKILTVSAALDSGTSDQNDTFSCIGYTEVGGWKIRCHKAGGHGSGFTLSYGLQMSCNPCMIAISERLGAEEFYSYIEAFGILEKTGIDLPSEAKSIFHQLENIGATELATVSFGQRFKVSIINLLTAVSAVANGGKLVTPYVVDKIIDTNGCITYTHETEIRRNVISEEVANTVSQILIDGVSGNGGAKNAAVQGYDVAAKTGTSQKFDVLDENGNSYLRIGSTVAYSTDSENGIAVIIVVDEPTSQVKYGSVVAAPYVAELLDSILPYLEFRSNSTDEIVSVGNYVGLTVDAAKNRLSSDGINYTIIGDGDYVVSQTPGSGDTMVKSFAKIILYTTDSAEYATVPGLVGKSLNEAIELAIESGLNIRITGCTSTTGNANIVWQSLPPGTKVKLSELITLRSTSTDFED